VNSEATIRAQLQKDRSAVELDSVVTSDAECVNCREIG